MGKTVNDLKNIGELLPVCETGTSNENSYVETVKEPKTIAINTLVTLTSYMIGMDISTMENHYIVQNGELIESLQKNKEATIIRYLCRLRTTLMLNFKKIDNQITYHLSNIDRMDFFHQDEIKALQSWGFKVVLANARADKYNESFCRLIDENIDSCKSLFPDWVNFEYIKDLFIIPQYDKANALRNEFKKYMANLNSYPFQMYIHWEPGDFGNILANDGKFLTTLYAQHGEKFMDRSKYRDATENTKLNIYEYINESKRVVIIVDCENSDVYKLFGVLKNLEADELCKIEKIVLYDDYHTSVGWDWLEKCIRIPVEHVEVERVADHKSLVDIRMTAGVCEAFYKDNIESFILCSSDSDFWGLISSLPEARFLVIYEYAKCGEAIKEALNYRRIYHCSMDDFYTGNAGELKKVVLKKELESILPNIVGYNAWALIEMLYNNARITPTESEKKRFFEKYIKTLKLKMDENGNFYIHMED